MFLAMLSDSVLRFFDDHNLTYESAAPLCNLSSRQLGNILRRHSNPSLRSFEKICLGLRKSPNELLGLPTDPSDLARLIPAPVMFVSEAASIIPVCPFCKHDLLQPKQAYCHVCGQKLDWSPRLNS